MTALNKSALDAERQAVGMPGWVDARRDRRIAELEGENADLKAKVVSQQDRIAKLEHAEYWGQ